MFLFSFRIRALQISLYCLQVPLCQALSLSSHACNSIQQCFSCYNMKVTTSYKRMTAWFNTFHCLQLLMDSKMRHFPPSFPASSQQENEQALLIQLKWPIAYCSTIILPAFNSELSRWIEVKDLHCLIDCRKCSYAENYIELDLHGFKG